jgi:radical SAM protein with 4Fe4S-binding SPASM domain
MAERQQRARGLPLLVPIFTKCRQNLNEMEAWYDQWLRILGSAAIRGPSRFGGLTPDVSVGDMAPPLRRPCSRLSSRVTALSDGRIVSCEEDVLARQVMGDPRQETLGQVWQKNVQSLRRSHRDGEWAQHPVCASCSEWHRA